MAWEYREQYEKLLETLEKDKRPWRPASLLPLDGTRVFLKCGVNYSGDRLYDVGCFHKAWWCPDGEWDTEFGNMEYCTGWKEVCDV